MHAKARRAKIYGELIGYGTAFDAPEGEGRLVHASRRSVKRALTAALRDAELDASEIDLICSAESGVRRMDAAERAGLAEVFAPDLPTVATKRIWGETFGAACAFSLAASLGWLAGNAPGPLVRGRQTREIRHVVIMAMGYYGNVSALIVRKG